MKKWKILTEKSKVCVIAPSYGVVSTDQVDVIPREAEEIIRLYNLTPIMYEHMMVPGNHTLFSNPELRFANSDEVRLKHLIHALNNPECEAVWCLRGGYGVNRLLEGLSKQPEPMEVKPLIGFSDITILHTFLNYQWGWPSIHFGMPGALPEVMKKPEMVTSLQNILFGRAEKVSFKAKCINEENVGHHQITGETSGGNKLLFERTLGTKFQPNLANMILMLEDIDEEARWLDGFLYQLKMTEGFKQMSAIVFGTILPANKEELFIKVISEFGRSIQIPIFQLDKEDTIGHGEINKALPMGTMAAIDYESTRDFYQLVVETGANFMVHEEL